MKKFLFLSFVAAIATTNHALGYEFEGYPTIFSDYREYEAYEGYEDYFFDQFIHLYRTYLKNWEIYYQTTDGRVMKQHFSIDPTDTILDGKTYARITLENSSIFAHRFQEPVDTLLFRQDGDRIYYLSAGGEEQLVLDFSLQTGDEFENPQGERFIVTDMPEADPYGEGYWQYDRTSSFYASRPPRILRLRSEESGQEDIWIEGVGSLDWGIVPLYVINSRELFDSIVDRARLFYAPGFNMSVSREVNEENYKLAFFNPKDIDAEVLQSEESIQEFLKGHPWTYSFSADTLCITGVQELNCYVAYAECVKVGNVVDVTVDQFLLMGDMPSCKTMRLVDVCISGFEASTYMINGEMVECKGKTDGIGEIQNSKLKIQNEYIYDLSGRRVTDGHRGLRIQRGRKEFTK